MTNKQIDININDNVAKWMQDVAKWRPCQRKSYTVYVIQPPVGFVVANKLEQLTGYDFIKKRFQQAGGAKRGIPFLDLTNNLAELEKVREGIKSGKLELTVVEEGRVLLCGTLGEVWTASADVVRSSYTLSDGKPVGEISKTEWMPIVRKGESAPSAKGMLLPVKYRGVLETKYGTRIMNDPRVGGHNAGDILVATTKKDGSLGLSTINNTVFANTFNLIVGGWSANKLVVPSQNSAQGSLLEQLNNMTITQACAKVWSKPNTKTPSQKKLTDAEKTVARQMADRAKANESAALKRIEELCEQYERGNAYQRADSEIEVGINEKGTFYTVSDYSESRGGSEYLQNLVPVKDISKDAVRKLCNKHGWYITF